MIHRLKEKCDICNKKLLISIHDGIGPTLYISNEKRYCSRCFKKELAKRSINEKVK